jgi:hypothetical protein
MANAADQQRVLLLPVALYRVLLPLSLLLTLYVVAMWRVALPTYDVVDHHAFLAAAALGELDWAGLWERHNGVHLIVLPKLVFWLDVYWLAGQGWLVTAVSALAIAATLLLVLQQIQQFDGLTAHEQSLFALLASLMLGSVLLAESLVNPIDIQWSLLALGTALVARGLMQPWRASWPWWLAGLAISWLSSGPLPLMLLALLLVYGLTGRQHRQPNRWLSAPAVLPCLLVIFLLLAGREWLALRQGWPLLLSHLYRPLVAASDWAGMEAYLREDPAMYGRWLGDAVSFVGRFVLVPAGHEWPWPWLVGLPLLIWLLAVQRSVLHWHAGQRFFVYLLLFPLLLALAAGWMRFFTLYNYRHANMGLLLLLSSLLLVYGNARWRHKAAALALVLSAYGCQFAWAIIDEAGYWAWEGRNITRLLQIGDALGIRDPAKFAPVWKDDPANPEAVANSRRVFREQRVGVYGTREYATYLGEIPLPSVEVTCEYRLHALLQHAPDPRAFVVQAEARAADGSYLTQAVLQQDGHNVGWAAAQMPSDILWQQWRQPWLFGGQLVLSQELTRDVLVIAFDRYRRCQPWPLPGLPAVDPVHHSP